MRRRVCVSPIVGVFVAALLGIVLSCTSMKGKGGKSGERDCNKTVEELEGVYFSGSGNLHSRGWPKCENDSLKFQGPKKWKCWDEDRDYPPADGDSKEDDLTSAEKENITAVWKYDVDKCNDGGTGVADPVSLP